MRERIAPQSRRLTRMVALREAADRSVLGAGGRTVLENARAEEERLNPGGGQLLEGWQIPHGRYREQLTRGRGRRMMSVSGGNGVTMQS